MKGAKHSARSSLYMKLSISFIAAMTALFLVMQLIFSRSVAYTRDTAAQRTDAALKQLVQDIDADILLLGRVEARWLFDQASLTRLTEGGRSPALLFDLYTQIKRRASLFVGNAGVNGIYMYFAGDAYLLQAFITEGEREQLRLALTDALSAWAPSDRAALYWVDGAPYVINAYRGDSRTYQDEYQYALIFRLSAEEWATDVADGEMIWIAGERGETLYASGAGKIGADEARAFLARVDEGAGLVEIGGHEYAATVRPLLGGAARVYYLSRIDVENIGDMSRNFTLALGASCLIICLGLWLIVARLIRQPIRRLSAAFLAMEQAGNWPRIALDSSRDMAELAERFNHMVEVQRDLVEHIHQSERLVYNAELRLLQAQINPHFLYNSFFLMNSLLELKEYGHLEQLTENLGLYFRYIFLSDDGMKTLADEVGHAAAYANIQTLRFFGRIQIEIEPVPEDWREEPVPAMIVQPLVENAFLHGFGRRSGGGELRLRFERQGEARLLLRVTNTGASMSDAELDELRERLRGAQRDTPTTALINTHRRLHLLYGTEGGLAVSNLGGNGFEVALTLLRKERNI